VVLPMMRKTRVMVPASVSVSAMVSGMRSPSSQTRRITKFPGLALAAICGASMTSSVVAPGMRVRLRTIRLDIRAPLRRVKRRIVYPRLGFT